MLIAQTTISLHSLRAIPDAKEKKIQQIQEFTLLYQTDHQHPKETSLPVCCSDRLDRLKLVYLRARIGLFIGNTINHRV